MGSSGCREGGGQVGARTGAAGDGGPGAAGEVVPAQAEGGGGAVGALDGDPGGDPAGGRVPGGGAVHDGVGHEPELVQLQADALVALGGEPAAAQAMAAGPGQVPPLGDG